MNSHSQHNFKIISTDFDGTLLTSDKRITNITANTLLALRESRRERILIIGITARNLSSIQNILDTNLFDYIIFNNGTSIYDISQNQITALGALSTDIVAKIFHNFHNISSQIDFCTTTHYYTISAQTTNIRPFVTTIHHPSQITEPISRINLFFETNQALTSAQALLESQFPPLNITSMRDTDNVNTRLWLTIQPHNTSKLSALKLLCQKTNIPLDDVMFFGDNTNDIELIQNTGLSVAMDNALDSVKSAADYTTLTNDANGIAVFLQNFFHL